MSNALDIRSIQQKLINPNMDGVLKVIKITTPFTYDVTVRKGTIDWSVIINDQYRNTFIRDLLHPYTRVKIISNNTFSTISYTRVNGNDTLKGNLKVMITPFTTERLELIKEDIILDLVDQDKLAEKAWKRRRRVYRKHRIPVIE